MSKFRTKFGKRLLAYVLTGAMIVSNMTSLTAFASTPTDEEEYKIETSSAIEETSDEEEKIVAENEEISDEEEKIVEEDNKADDESNVPEGSKAPESQNSSESQSTPPTQEEPATEWIFSASSGFADGTASPYKGLVFTGGEKENTKDHLVMNDGGKITVPVNASTAGKVVVKAYYNYSFNFEGGKKIARSPGGTSNVETFEYYYDAGTSKVDINVTGTSYFVSIKVDTDTDITMPASLKWDFTKYADTHSGAVAGTTPITEWDGLVISGGKYHGTSYGLTISNSSIMIPVEGDCKITVVAGYTYQFGFYNLDSENKRADDGDDFTATLDYVGGKGMVPIIVGNTATYIKSISIEPKKDEGGSEPNSGEGSEPGSEGSEPNSEEGSEPGSESDPNESDPGAGYRTGTIIWYFNGTEAEHSFNGTFQGSKGTFDGLIIDATALGAKLSARGSDSQFNANTIISVPVSSNAEVTVVSYPGYHNYTVGGTVATADSFTYTHNGEAGYVDVKATAESYLYSIKVVNIDESGSATEESSAINNSTEEGSEGDGSSASEESSAIDDSSEETSEVDDSDEEEESQPIKDDTVEVKIPAYENKKTIKMSDESAIKIQAADIVENKKYDYSVSVTYTYTTTETVEGNTVTHEYQQQLTEGVHYEVEKIKNDDGTYYVMVYGLGETDLGTFVDSAKSNDYKIWTSKEAKDNKTKDLSKAKIKLDYKSATFTGSYITPGVTVTDPADKTKNLTEGTDYTIVYKNNVNVGKASVTVIGTKGETGYFGSATATFTIKAAPLAKSTVNITADNIKEGLANNADKKGKVKADEKNEGDFAYKGEPITFKNLTLELVSGNEKTMLSPSTYTVTYKKNTAKGTATATIKGLNNVSGAITISYDITNAVADTAIKGLENSTATTPLVGEYSSKGVRLTKIEVGGVTLKENVDYKADYKECSKTADLNNSPETVYITGLGSYKKVFEKVPVQVKTGKGEFHLKKSGVTVDKSKIYDKKTGNLDAKKLISTAKITDAAGVTIKPEAIAKIKLGNNKITLEPSSDNAANYQKTELIDLHVATKITAALKQNKADVLKGYFDGVNTVTTTETAIIDTLTKLTATPAVLTDPAITANDISIVSYKNNHKLGNATVTIQATDNSAYYGTMNVKFTIAAVNSDAERTESKSESYEWSFKKGSELLGENGVVIQGSTGTVKLPGDTGTEKQLEIDATASGAKFQTKDRDDWAQVNTGTIIKVPVAGASKVTVTVYPDSKYTVDGKENTADEEDFLCKGTDGYVTIVMTSNGYIGTIKVESIDPSEIPTDPDDPDDPDDPTGPNPDLPYVWDFAAGALEFDDDGNPTKYIDSTKYNNMLTEDIMNSWYGDVAAGTAGTNLSSFEVKDDNDQVVFKFEGNGKTNNRIRTNNSKVTRYDSSTKKDPNDTVYMGYVYSNSSATPEVYLGILLDEGDIVTAVVSSNGGDSLIEFNLEDDSAIAQSYEYKAGLPTLAGGTANAGIATFYASKAGMYKMYSTNEKLVVARVTVEKTKSVAVSGSVTAPESLTGDYSIKFTCKETGAVKTAKVENGAYTVDLKEQYTYDVALDNANGYIITNQNASFKLPKGEDTFTYDVTVGSVDLVTVTGEIQGFSAVAGGAQNPIENMNLVFTSDQIYVPELTLGEGNNFTLVLEKGVQYAVTAEGVEDFTLQTTTISATDNGTANITFEAKPVWDVTITSEDVTAEQLATIQFIFSRVYIEDSVKKYDEDYVYTFTGTDNIKLRDGQYEITTKSDYTQKLTADLKVEGGNKTFAIKFDVEPRTTWDFKTDTSLRGSENGVQIQNTTGTFKGLEIDATNGKFDSKNRTDDAQFNSGTKITIPVTGACKVIIDMYGDTYTVTGDAVTEDAVTGDKVKTVTVTQAGNVVITATGNTYLNSIKIEYSSEVEYSSKITVGEGKDYATINEALEAVGNMDRTDDDGNIQRVTIEIQPGNYEEMLVVKEPNVTLKNANANPSITPINKGVDIADSSVRITSYYGHGYAYYSMGADCKWNADILAVNKANGCLSFENPGTGTTSGSYWNATVVIGADGFEADGIIFENSFNQYVSKKAAEDVIVPLSGAQGESLGARNDMEAGSTEVQNKKYVERAAALAIMNNYKQINFNNCSFIGRQDTLFGGVGVTAAYYGCDIYGGTDYIMGGMTAVFAKCNLVFNTMEDNNDVGYITAAQQASGRGYLMYNCTVTSTKPGVNTASEKTSKPGYFGRPWTTTSEALFYKTIIESTNYNGKEESLIVAGGWNDTLSGKAALSQEYASIELAEGVDNSANRVSWAAQLTAGEDGKITLADGTTEVDDATVISAFLGSWNPFEGKDLTIVTE